MKHNQVEKLRLSGKEKIIESAIHWLEEKQPDLHLNYNDYEITVWTNTSKVLVKFRSLFKIFSSGNLEVTSRAIDFSVDLINKELNLFCLYSLTGYEEKLIQFIKENTNLPYKEKRDYIYEIYDREEYLDIFIRLNGSFINFCLDKRTGKQSGYNELNVTPAQMPLIDRDETDFLKELY